MSGPSEPIIEPAQSPTPLLKQFHQTQREIERVLSKRFFFIVGCQKSGTTWLQHLLAGHPEIVCRGEAIFGPVLSAGLDALLKEYNRHSEKRNARLGVLEALTFDQRQRDQLLLTAMALMISRWPGVERCRWIGEKTPEHAHFLPALSRFFPGCRVLHIIRDGRDVAVSGWHHNLRKEGEAFRARFRTMAHYVEFITRTNWTRYIAQARRFGRVAPHRYLEVRYESLHEDPCGETRRLLEFLDLDPAPEVVRRCVESGSFSRLSGDRDPGQEDRSSFFRKGAVGDWRDQLDAASLEAFERHGGRLRRELGYAD